MFKRISNCAVVLLAGFIANAEPLATALTPESAVATALAANRDLAAARLAIHEAQGRLKQAGLWPNPEVELGRQSDRVFANEGEYSFSAGFKQRFPVTGRLAKAKAVARVDVAQAMAEVRNQERLLAGETLRLSREWLVTQEMLRANQELQSIIRKQVELSETRLKLAEVSATDVNLAKLELQKLVLAEAALSNQQEIASTTLNLLLGREPKSTLLMSGAVGAELDTNTVAEVSRQALTRRPDRQLTALGIDRAGAEIRLAKAQKWEDWTLGFGYARERSIFREPIRLDDTDNLIGLSVSIPLPFWNRNQGRIKEAQATRQRAEAELKALELRIVVDVQSSENQMRRWLGILRQYRNESIKLAEENISLLQKGYADGLVNITAVIQGQQQLTELRQNSLEALGEFWRAKTEWETSSAAVLPAE